ncbi:hypothetical protein [Chondromyces crocatus]|uniref:hypothetical protein n=1 Tax=Chondromyces crocatus TaxID=52 RepID=UPI0012E0EEE9|nr:hypothetical protein [Chondromyces crocatus]
METEALPFKPARASAQSISSKPPPGPAPSPLVPLQKSAADDDDPLARTIVGAGLTAEHILPFLAPRSGSAGAAVGRTSPGDPAAASNAPLPFRQVQPAQTAASSQLKEDPLNKTTVGALAPSGDPLPFQAAASRPAVAEAPPRAPAPNARSATASPRGAVPAPLPAPAPAATPPPPPPRAQGADLDIYQYAALCAELAVFPGAVEATFQRYGLHEPARRAAVDTAWKARLQADARAYATWQEHYRRIHAYWTAQVRQGGR